MGYRGDADLEDRLRRRLLPLAGEAGSARPGFSDFDLNPEFRPAAPDRPLTPAAVLTAIVRRPEGYTVLLTQRSAEMPTHAGQIAFPGGRIQAGDNGPLAAALREAEEEVGLDPRLVIPLGAADPYETVTGFHVTPIIALVEPGFSLRLDPREVADVFETPAQFLFNPANHQRQEREWKGLRRAYFAMPYEGRYIWGATAGMIRGLTERLYGAGA